LSLAFSLTGSCLSKGAVSPATQVGSPPGSRQNVNGIGLQNPNNVSQNNYYGNVSYITEAQHTNNDVSHIRIPSSPNEGPVPVANGRVANGAIGSGNNSFAPTPADQFNNTHNSGANNSRNSPDRPNSVGDINNIQQRNQYLLGGSKGKQLSQQLQQANDANNPSPNYGTRPQTVAQLQSTTNDADVQEARWMASKIQNSQAQTVSKLRIEISDLKSENARLGSIVKQLESEKLSAESERNGLRNELESTQLVKSDLSEEKRRIAMDHENLKMKLDQIEHENRLLTVDKEREQNSHSSQRSQWEHAHKELAKENESKKRENEILSSKLAESNAKIANLQTDLRNLQQELSQKAATNENAVKQSMELQAELNRALNMRDDLEGTLSFQKNFSSDLQAAKDNLEQTLQKTKVEHEVAVSQITRLFHTIGLVFFFHFVHF